MMLTLFKEFLIFLRRNLRWWLLPTIVTFLVILILLLFSGAPAIAPFLYRR